MDRQTERVNTGLRKIKARRCFITAAVILSVVLIVVTCLCIEYYFLPQRGYDRAMAYYNAGDYITAADAFAEMTDYKDSAEKMEDCLDKAKNQKYNYIINHLDREDYTTYQYIKDLMEEDYKDVRQIFDTLYAWQVKIIANYSDADTTTDLDVLVMDDNICIHIIPTGGYPGERIELALALRNSDGFADSRKIKVKDGDNYAYHSEAFANAGWFEVKVVRSSRVAGAVKEVEIIDR